MHDRPADEFFNRAAEVIAKAEDPAAGESIYLRLYLPLRLDSECHPYVER